MLRPAPKFGNEQLQLKNWFYFLLRIDKFNLLIDKKVSTITRIFN
jgi:hypothetical protein